MVGGEHDGGTIFECQHPKPLEKRAHLGVRTQDLPGECREADIVVAAVGRPEMVKGDWIKPGATVIDVGINRIETEDGGTKLVGDVEFGSAAEVAGAITPVPGGVGPMTIACLLHNTMQQACRINGIEIPD